MNELSQFLVESILGEADSVDNVVVVYAGRFQPFHKGHYELFKKSLERTGQVIIMIRNMPASKDNPFDVEEVKKNIEEALIEYQFLLNDDDEFAENWNDCKNDFYEWCSLYDDLKHITKGE